jgi:hypothetical protein
VTKIDPKQKFETEMNLKKKQTQLESLENIMTDKLNLINQEKGRVNKEL